MTFNPVRKRLAVRVSPAAERALRQGHPWVFDGAIRGLSPADGLAGDLAVVFDRARKFLAIGLYDPDSPLRIRILQHHQPAAIDAVWFAARIEAALAKRAPLLDEQTNACRLIHGENDGLPGLVVDRYAEVLVVKLDTGAWFPHLPQVLAALLPLTQVNSAVLRLSRSVDHGALRDGSVLHGTLPAGEIEFVESGLRFGVDPRSGQKTGFFLDQRENRQRVRAQTRNEAVLDVFAYVGSFSLYAANGGATAVTSVDLSRPALAAVERNFQRNNHLGAVARARHEMIAGDAFTVLQSLRDDGRRFGVVITDPPPFARKAEDIQAALTAYRRLGQLGVSVLQPGGLLVAASCSSRVSPEAFFAAVHDGAESVGRRLQVVERTEHPLDHPVGYPEGAYLKCLFARVP